MHDLTLPHTHVPGSLKNIIGLGLKFIPVPRRPNRKIPDSFSRFTKDFHTKVYFSGRPLISEEVYNSKLHVDSEWIPKPWDIPPDIHDRTNAFRRQILKLLRVKRAKSTNILPFQNRALSALALRTDVLVVNCDKNLGPALINTSTYVERAFKDHLSKPEVYKQYTEDEATTHMEGVAKQVKMWMHKYSTSTKKRKGLSNQSLKYLRATFDPDTAKLPVLYLTLKVHKDP